MAVNKSYIGKGIVYLADDNDALIDVGNVTEFSYSAEEDKKELKNFRTAGGGNYNTVTRVDAVNLSLTMSDFSAENLKLGLFGGASAIASGSVTDEAQTTPGDVSVDCLVPTDFMIDIDQSVTVTGYVEGTDFEKKAAGILVLAAGSIPASTALAISYTKKAVNKVEAFINAAAERKLVLDGLNEAQSNAPVRVTVWAAKFGPAEETPYIGDEFGEITVTGDAIPDTSITASDESQYLKIEVA